MKIRILDPANNELRGGLPWTKTLDTDCDTPELAYQDAVLWATAYEQRDRMGNMACVLGVTLIGGKYRGVVNYFHSNT